MTHKERQRARYLDLKAKGQCVTCAVSKAMKGKARCYGCQQKQKRYDVLHRIQFLPVEQLSSEELYKRAKSEREVVSWCWKHPA